MNRFMAMGDKNWVTREFFPQQVWFLMVKTSGVAGWRRALCDGSLPGPRHRDRRPRPRRPPPQSNATADGQWNPSKRLDTMLAKGGVLNSMSRWGVGGNPVFLLPVSPTFQNNLAFQPFLLSVCVPNKNTSRRIWTILYSCPSLSFQTSLFFSNRGVLIVFFYSILLGMHLRNQAFFI